MKKNMKPFSLVIAAIVIVAITTLTSCEKETPLQSHRDWKTEMKSLNDQMASSPHSSAQKKSWLGCAAADAGGALTGAAAGSEIGGHFGQPGWGAAIGAAVGGAAASISYWGKVMAPSGGSTVFNPEPVISSNPQRIVGELHNEICMAAVGDPDILFPDGRVNMQRLEEISLPIISARIGVDGDVPDSAIDAFSKENEIIVATIDTKYSPSVGTSDAKYFFEQFQKGLRSCHTKEDVHNYCCSLETLIGESDMDNDSKEAILGSISVMRNSTNLWY